MSKLIVVPTPIGNLNDITFRAIDILRKVDLILAEDMRKTKIMLNHFDINTRMQSYHQVNEHQVVENICQKIEEGKTAALVSDGGTPSISDPGYLIINQCIKKSIPIECLPGATAFIPALICSGLPSERFCFEGFLPRKKGRTTRLAALSKEKRTVIIYESPKRLLTTLGHLIDYFGNDRMACVSREISKIYEEHQRGTLNELFNYYNEKSIKGEIVITIKGKK